MTDSHGQHPRVLPIATSPIAAGRAIHIDPGKLPTHGRALAPEDHSDELPVGGGPPLRRAERQPTRGHDRHDQGDTLRAAQIAAVVDLLARQDRTVIVSAEHAAAELVDAVMALADTNTGRLWVFSLDAKPDVLFADGTHRYWSTHCRHDPGDGSGHRACSATELVGPRGLESIERRPAQCKTCAAPCICPCHAESLSAPESGQERPTHPDLPDEGRTGRGGETAGRDEAVCICPQIETTTFADLEARERTFVRGKPNPNCPVCPDVTERTEP